MSPSPYIASLRRSVLATGRLAAIVTAATLLVGGMPASAVTQSAEACPGNTTLAAGFDWTAGGWAASGSAGGISVWGDTALARWSTTEPAISAVVITAGTTTINYTYDPVSTDGAVAASDVEDAAGAALQHLGFCTGPGTLPTSGSKISVGVSKTAACATLNADQTASVEGMITVVRHTPSAIRVRTTRDTVLASDGSNLGETTSIVGLTGVVMEPGTDTLEVPYSVTFTPGTATAFTNKIEITIEEASGLDRHKYYSARADFSLCQPAPKPTLLIEKVANVHLITISGPANAQTAAPSSVTWTLSYTMTNGPVTNAVITDPLPAGVTFVSASNGGTLGADGKTVTWNLGTLSASGSVSLVTSVNVATISRTGPTVNLATIVSDQTAPETGQDSVTVKVNPPPLAGHPTPTPIIPNTAVAFGPGGQPVSVPIELLVALFLGSLGGLLFANVRAVQRHRR